MSSDRETLKYTTMSTLEFMAASIWAEAVKYFTLDSLEFCNALEVLSDPDWRAWLGKPDELVSAHGPSEPLHCIIRAEAGFISDGDFVIKEKTVSIQYDPTICSLEEARRRLFAKADYEQIKLQEEVEYGDRVKVTLEKIDGPT